MVNTAIALLRRNPRLLQFPDSSAVISTVTEVKRGAAGPGTGASHDVLQHVHVQVATTAVGKHVHVVDIATTAVAGEHVHLTMFRLLLLCLRM